MSKRKNLVQLNGTSPKGTVLNGNGQAVLQALTEREKKTLRDVALASYEQGFTACCEALAVSLTAAVLKGHDSVTLPDMLLVVAELQKYAAEYVEQARKEENES